MAQGPACRELLLLHGVSTDGVPPAMRVVTRRAIPLQDSPLRKRARTSTTSGTVALDNGLPSIEDIARSSMEMPEEPDQRFWPIFWVSITQNA
eukprot:681172-Amphidinium_carterae.1